MAVAGTLVLGQPSTVLVPSHIPLWGASVLSILVFTDRVRVG